MSYQVIARKWRPQTFAEIVGQQHVTRTLQNAIQSGRVAHAYIFSGARGVGKTTTARILAKALNCVHGLTPSPCNECDSCREIASGSSLDVLEIDAASNRGIDQVRELREMVRYAPVGGRYKVIILDEAHMLTDEASNALLKTLEEPPEKVVFVMATTQPEDLVETIRSRSQHFHFRALSFAEIVAALEDIAAKEGLTIEAGAVAVMAGTADGSLRDALSLIEQARAYCGAAITEAQLRELLGIVSAEVLDELVAAIENRSTERALALVHRLLAEGQNLQQFCREAISHFRNVLVARVCGADSDLIAASIEDRPRLARAAAGFSEEDLTRFFQILLLTEDDLRRKPDPRLHLEMGLLRLVNAARLAPLEEVLAELSGNVTARAPTPQLNAEAGTTAHAAPAKSAVSPPAPVSTNLNAGLPPLAALPSIPNISLDSNTGAASAVAPALERGTNTSSSASANGLEASQVDAIKAESFAQAQFLGELVDGVARWELEAGEVRLYFPTERRALADLLQSRDRIEKLRTIASRVLGQQLRVCVKLETTPALASGVRAGETSRELRARFEQDPIVRAMLERFGGRISEVKRRDEG
ncbi:MAG: DNA polymerase III subunit gamma/tau [Acidobacteria bacterium]|nr:MAG: DNA polymerase III subunit gamma/tau [Acidobacteriota bacterium]